jgi:hypothetical protein
MPHLRRDWNGPTPAASAGVPLSDVKCEKGRTLVQDITDGKRENTLALLWRILFLWKLSELLDVQTLHAEVARVTRLHRRSSLGARATTIGTGPEATEALRLSSEKIALLLEWVRVVCKGYGVDVANFTTDMSDGRVLCLLIHYYLPEHLSAEQLPFPTNAGQCRAFDAKESALPADVQLQCWQLAHSKAIDLGGVPQVATATAPYMCTRLLKCAPLCLKSVPFCLKCIHYRLGCVPLSLKCVPFTPEMHTLTPEL